LCKGTGIRGLRHCPPLLLEQSEFANLRTDGIPHLTSHQDKAESLVSELQSSYPSQLFVTAQADLADRESTRSFVSRILGDAAVAEKHKAISVLVANAGIGRRIRDVKDIGEQDWDEMIEVNIRSQFVVTKACVEGMRAQGWGRVILVGSIASRGSGLNGCHYAASKGALWSVSVHYVRLFVTMLVSDTFIAPWA
jgi:3-oxoacyl-[acyl-carrier protein] reductase